MDNKLKLVRNLLIEIEALEEGQPSTGTINLACLIIRDAKELAQIVQEEENQKKAA